MSVKKIGEATPRSYPEESWSIKGGNYDFRIDENFWTERLEPELLKEDSEAFEDIQPLKEREPPHKRKLTRTEKLHESLWGPCEYSKQYTKEYAGYKEGKKAQEDRLREQVKRREKKRTEQRVEMIAKIKEGQFDHPVPLRLCKDWDKYSDVIYCFYKRNVYKFDRPRYSDDEMIYQIMESEDRERRNFERLKHKFSLTNEEDARPKRERVPEEVRVAVWRRDEGKCVKCGSRERLEYDHIIPVSKGGSDTVRNLELLCERCNREKRDHIG